MESKNPDHEDACKRSDSQSPVQIFREQLWPYGPQRLIARFEVKEGVDEPVPTLVMIQGPEHSIEIRGRNALLKGAMVARLLQYCTVRD